MDYKYLLVTVENNIAKITFNRPDNLNAFNEELLLGLMDLIPKLEADPEIRVFVFTGAGRAFSAGGDVKNMARIMELNHGEIPAPYQDLERSRRNHEFLKKIYYMEKPIIMAVNGVAAGAGSNLALSGDIIIASEKAEFSQAFVRIGLIPDWGGMYYLPRLIGLPKAKELIFTGKKISAVEAESIGLINKAVPEEEFELCVAEYADILARAPTRALALAKRIMTKGLDMNYDEVLENEAYGQLVARRTSDHREGVAAFIEKRRPQFTGK